MVLGEDGDRACCAPSRAAPAQGSCDNHGQSLLVSARAAAGSDPRRHTGCRWFLFLTDPYTIRNQKELLKDIFFKSIGALK